MAGEAGRFEPYVPRVATEWDDHAQGSFHRTITGTLLFVDISGFTNLSERLARRGRIGAEELTLVLNRVFGSMLDLVYARGGSLLKFGGDALLLLFDSEDSVMQATTAAVEMRAALRDASKEKTSVGRIDLKMSSGVHFGDIDFFLIGESHRELLVTGPAASTTTAMEGTADAGEIVVSEAVREKLPPDFIGDPKGPGWLLRKQKIHHPKSGAVARSLDGDLDFEAFVPSRLRDQIATGITDSEHRLATIGFLKFKGVDSLLAEGGTDLAGNSLHRLVASTQRAADEEGVTFLSSDIDTDGGKIILATGVPTSQHDDEGRMLRAARAILDADSDLDVRIGLNRGHVFTGDVGTPYRRTYTVMGDTVNLAARLMATSPPGGLYASPSVLDGSSTLFRTQALEPFHVKGKEKPVTAYEVFEEIGTRPPESRHELPFHGREPELEMIVSIITTCARIGRGGMMTVSGDTGIGKSRLIAEVLDRCPGMATMTIKAEPNGSEHPYWAFRDPMRRKLGIRRSDMTSMVRSLRAAVASLDSSLLELLPLLGDVVHIEIPDNETTAVIDPRFRPDRTADLIISLLERLHDRPVAVVAEDAQWLDEPSRGLLMKIGEAAESRPWSVVATVRGTEDHDAGLFGNEVTLGALDDPTIREIAIEATESAPLRPHELDGIVARVGGNPLFLSEILAAIRSAGSADEIPETLDAVVSTQIDTLPPLARQTLRYSSVLGTSFPTLVLERLLEHDGIQIDSGTQSDLDRFLEADSSERWRFKHAVVHDVAYQGLPYRRRRELHGRAAEVVEAMAGEDPSASAEFLAFHYSEAGRHDKALRYSRDAAEKAKQAYANAEAAIHFTRAIAAARSEAQSSDAVIDLWTGLGDVQHLSGQYEAARDSYRNAIQHASGDPVRVADLRVKRAVSWYGVHRLDQAKRELTLARGAVAKDSVDGLTGALARISAFEASVHAAAGDPVRARATANQAITLALEAGDDESLARAYTALDWAGFVLGDGSPRRGEEAVEIYQRLGLVERSVFVLNNLGAFSYFEGDWDAAMHYYQLSVEAAEKSGNVVEAANTRTAMAEVYIGQRNVDAALPLLGEADRVVRSSGAVQIQPFVRLHAARAARASGLLDKAVMELTDLFNSQVEDGETPFTGEIGVALADTLVDLDRSEEADRVLTQLQSFAPESFGAVEAGARRVRSRIALLQGDMTTAVSLALNALEMASENRDLYSEVLILEELSALELPKDNAETIPARLAELSGRLGIEPA